VTLPAPLRAAFLLVVGFAAAAHAQSAAPVRSPAAALSVEDAWVRVIPGATVAAAYMTLRNHGSATIVVVGAHSALGPAMIHESKTVDGQSQMRPIERLAIPAGGVVQLKPGGLHVMLPLPGRAPLPGDEVPITLELEGGGTLAVSARVRPLAAD
jgi:periplasmic copper chaperone A